MTNLLFIQKVKVSERKHLTQMLRVCVQNLLNKFTMFFNVHMGLFCFSVLYAKLS